MDSFKRVQNWVKELRKVVGTNIVLTLAGNKCDLKGKQVTEEEALEYAKSVGATHIYTSAKANKNVNEAFLDTVKRILEKNFENRASTQLSTSDDSFLNTSSRKSGVVVIQDEPETNTQDAKKCC